MLRNKEPLVLWRALYLFITSALLRLCTEGLKNRWRFWRSWRTFFVPGAMLWVSDSCWGREPCNILSWKGSISIIGSNSCRICPQLSHCTLPEWRLPVLPDGTLHWFQKNGYAQTLSASFQTTESKLFLGKAEILWGLAEKYLFPMLYFQK